MTAPRPSAGTSETLGVYELGATPLYAATGDQRFGYYLYVPKAFTWAQAADYALCVVVHGTGRTPSVYRDLFADFAERNRVIILAPLFPAGIGEPRELSNYKFIAFQGIRFDEVLLGMVAEVSARYRIAADRFLMFGFSGGAHFAHRFFYLHPGRLHAVSIGAPGMVTLIDPATPWWRGTRDLTERFGIEMDLEAMREIPVHMVVGADDLDTWEITLAPGHPHWMEHANAAGRTRIDRIQTLKANFEAHGIKVRLDMAPGVGHNGYAVLDAPQKFFEEVLAGLRTGKPA